MDKPTSTDDTIVPKLCCIVIFTVSSLFMALLPLTIHKRYKDSRSAHTLGYNNLFRQLTAFGGGVLLSTTFLHLLPEIRECVEDLQKKNVIPEHESLPLSELLMCIGFLFLYVLEEVAHKYVESRSESKNNHCVVEFVNQVYPIAENGSSKGEFSSEVVILSREDGIGLGKDFEKAKIAAGINGHDYGSGITSANATAIADHHPQGAEDLEHDHSRILFTEASGKNFLLIFALSVHEGFEGLAIGLQTQRDAVWYMLLGVGTHKLVIAFCVGVQMLSMRKQQTVAIFYIIVFATTTSVGVAVGLLLSTESGIVAVILQGLASGTLLYVVFFELLKPNSHKSPCLGVFVGFTLMAVLKYYAPS